MRDPVPTGCAGWTAVDLGSHLLSDARRALVALHTPVGGLSDTHAVDYRTAWHPPEPGDHEELWSTRVAASVHGGLHGIAAVRGDVVRGAGGGPGGSR